LLLPLLWAETRDPLSPLLFVIILDILAALFAMADWQGVLKTNRFLQSKHRISLYADDVIIFSELVHRDLEAIILLLHNFGEASGLFTNFLKSCIIPIHYQGMDISSAKPKHSHVLTSGCHSLTLDFTRVTCSPCLISWQPRLKDGTKDVSRLMLGYC
jgi:hypothetical protein